MVELNPIGSQILGNLLVSFSQSRVVRGETNEELVRGVGQQVFDLLGLVDQDGASLVNVLDEGDEAAPVSGTCVLHHKLLVPVQPGDNTNLYWNGQYVKTISTQKYYSNYSKLYQNGFFQYLHIFI